MCSFIVNLGLCGALFGWHLAATNHFRDAPPTSGVIEPFKVAVGDGRPGGVHTAGNWRLIWDTHADGSLETAHELRLELKVINGQLVGQSAEPSGSQTGNMLLVGQILPGRQSVLSLRQDSPEGTVTLFVGHVTSPSRMEGTFGDNQGNRGDWALVAEPMTSAGLGRIKPAASELPDEKLLESVLGVYGQAIRGERHPYINLRPPRRDLWTEEIQECVKSALSYEEVDYVGRAKIFVPEKGTYTVELPGAGVEFRMSGRRLEAGDVELDRGLYDVEIYTNHWGQPYLTYAEVGVVRTGSSVTLPFFNTAVEVRAFRKQRIGGNKVIEVCDYAARPVSPDQRRTPQE